MARLDPRIGQLVTGKFYCFPDGYDKPELVGTLEEVEFALGIRQIKASANESPVAEAIWTVTLRFEYPAWDEVEGIAYRGIRAPSKAKANALARKQAEQDGYIGGGKGRVWFSAELETG